MRNSALARDTGLWRDMAALRRYFWLPLAAVAVAVVAALGLGSLVSDSGEARFRVNVVVDALPPLFGPAVLPGPFDYAAVATSDAVVADVATRTGATAEALRPRLKAEPRVNSPEISFSVTGDKAIDVARAWEAAFRDAAGQATPGIEERLVEPYRVQQAQARAQLEAAEAAAAGSPADAVRQQDRVAAGENYKTATMLVQSYETVTATMKAEAFTVKAPREYGGGLGSTPARVGAGAAIGLLAGIIGAVLLDMILRRREASVYGVEDTPVTTQRETSSVR